jgi:hypothetical protein
MLFATQKTYFRRLRQRGGERFGVDCIADIGLDSFSYGSSYRRRHEYSHSRASGFCSFPHLGRATSTKGPHRHRWPRSKVLRRVEVEYSATLQYGVERNANET